MSDNGTTLQETAAARRAERAAWLGRFPPLPSGYMGAPEPMTLLREARACYIAGHLMSTILAAAAHVEHTLAEELQLRGIIAPGDSPSFEGLIRHAGAHHLFRVDHLTRIDSVRLARNPLTHRKPHDHAHAIGNRLRAEQRSPDLILQEDAMLALEVMHGLFFSTLRPMGDDD